MECVYCAVRAESLNEIQVNFRLIFICIRVFPVTNIQLVPCPHLRPNSSRIRQTSEASLQTKDLSSSISGIGQHWTALDSTGQETIFVTFLFFRVLNTAL
jgi:hypothetical protein